MTFNQWYWIAFGKVPPAHYACDMEKAWEAAQKAEREACAQIADQLADGLGDFPLNDSDDAAQTAAMVIASAIRARTKP